MNARKRESGFTLVELLVVIAIIGILIGLLLPAINAARESGRRTACSNNLRQTGLAIIAYAEAYQAYPPPYVDSPATGTLIWILPFCESNAVYKQYNFRYDWDSPETRRRCRRTSPCWFAQVHRPNEITSVTMRQTVKSRAMYTPRWCRTRSDSAPEQLLRFAGPDHGRAEHAAEGHGRTLPHDDVFRGRRPAIQLRWQNPPIGNGQRCTVGRPRFSIFSNRHDLWRWRPDRQLHER